VCKTLGFNFTSSKNQTFPSSYLVKDINFRKSLIYGLWLGDGNISKKGLSASYGTTSLKLANKVLSLLRTCGIYSRIRKNGKDNLWHVRVATSSMPIFNTCIPVFKYKYKKIKFDSLSKVNGNENSFLDLKAFALKLRKDFFNSLEVEDTGDVVYPINIFSAITENCLRFIRKFFPSSIIKVNLDGKSKPTSCAPKGIIQYAETRLYKNRYISKNIPLPPEYNSNMSIKKWVHSINFDNNQMSILRKLLKSEASVEEIKAITNIGKKNVYDLEIENESNFLVNGIVVHNCKHLVKVVKKILEKGW
jgi:intein/homing endonuclease